MNLLQAIRQIQKKEEIWEKAQSTANVLRIEYENSEEDFLNYLSANISRHHDTFTYNGTVLDSMILYPDTTLLILPFEDHKILISAQRLPQIDSFRITDYKVI
jgi:hypothetical protein